MDKRLGLLINFGEHLIKHGIKRIANGMPEEPPGALILFLLFAPSRLRVKDSSWDCIAEISRKGAKTLRFGKEVAGLVDILTSLPCFNFSVLFTPSRLLVKDSLTHSEAEVSRKGAKALRCFASSATT